MPFSPDRRVLILAANWHRDLVYRCVDSCRGTLAESGLPGDRVDVIDLPGSLEMPAVAKAAALTGRYACIGCCGLVVDGGIYRHEFVAQAVVDGIVRASMETGVPVLSAVLTPQRFNEHSRPDHDFFHQHLVIKGRELAAAMLSIVPTMNRLRGG